MKVIIPVAGVGSRLRPHTHSVPKALIKVGGKAIIEHALDELNEVEAIDEVIFIIGYLGDHIRSFIESRKANYNFDTAFVWQDEFKGLGHAIYLAKDKLKSDEPLLIILGDMIFRFNLNDIINIGQNIIALKSVPNPQRFGIAVVKRGVITELIEKPEDPPSDLAIVGLYYFLKSGELFEAIEHIIKNDIKTRGEYQLTDALKIMLESGIEFHPFIIEEWYDCGEKDVLLKTNRAILEEMDEEYNIDGSVIIKPVHIGDNVIIENSIIGPNVSIGDNSRIVNSIIKDSIIGEGAEIVDFLLCNSLIGDNNVIKGDYKQLNSGPDSEIILR